MNRIAVAVGLSIGLWASAYAQALESVSAAETENGTVSRSAAVAADDGHDTLLVIRQKDETAQEAEEDAREAAEEAAERAREEAEEEQDNETRGVASFAFNANLLNLDTRPLQKIVANEQDLTGKHFDFANNKLLTFGLMGYGGPRHGLRTGVNFSGGYKAFYSDEYATNLTDSLAIAANDGRTTLDSAAVLHVGLGYGAFLAEKHFTFFERLNLIVGGMVGGGAMVVVKDFISAEARSPFQDASGSATVEDSAGINIRVSVTPMWAFDLHGGLSYRVTTWLSVGIEANALFLYSSSGFGYGYGSFGSFNPGGRLRIVLGNAG